MLNSIFEQLYSHLSQHMLQFLSGLTTTLLGRVFVGTIVLVAIILRIDKHLKSMQLIQSLQQRKKVLARLMIFFLSISFFAWALYPTLMKYYYRIKPYRNVVLCDFSTGGNANDFGINESIYTRIHEILNDKIGQYNIGLVRNPLVYGDNIAEAWKRADASGAFMVICGKIVNAEGARINTSILVIPKYYKDSVLKEYCARIQSTQTIRTELCDVVSDDVAGFALASIMILCDQYGIANDLLLKIKKSVNAGCKNTKIRATNIRNITLIGALNLYCASRYPEVARLLEPLRLNSASELPYQFILVDSYRKVGRRDDADKIIVNLLKENNDINSSNFTIREQVQSSVYAAKPSHSSMFDIKMESWIQESDNNIESTDTSTENIDLILDQPLEDNSNYYGMQIPDKLKYWSATHQKPTNQNDHFGMGLYYQSISMKKEAISEYKIALKDTNQKAACLYNIALMLNDINIAIKLIKQSLLIKDDAFVRSGLAEIYYENNMKEEALKEAEYIIKHYGGFHLGALIFLERTAEEKYALANSYLIRATIRRSQGDMKSWEKDIIKMKAVH